MTASWAPFADGVSLSTLRTNINAFNKALEVDMVAVENDISTLDTAKISSADTGLLFVQGSGVPYSLTTTYQKVILANAIGVDAANGHITGDVVAGTITVNTNGIYKFVFSGAMTANNGALVTFNYNVNGASLITTPPVFIGSGANPVHIENHMVMNLTAGSVIYVEAKCDSTCTMTPTSSAMMIEKTHF